MRTPAALVLSLAAVTGLTAADLPRERQVVDQVQVPVSSRQEITINARSDRDVRTRELWYARHDGRNWGSWQRHGTTFERDTPITWTPPEGHWKIYVRIEEVSGMTMAQPDQNTSPDGQFIIDRSAPAVQITSPVDASKLRGGQRYNITWNVTDPHLHSTPVTIRWSLGGDEWTTVAEHIPNSGTFEWTTPADMTPGGKLEITAADKAGNVGRGQNTGIVVDAVPPMRNILGPDIVNTRAVGLAIRAQDAGPAGLATVRLWSSANNGESWSAGPEVSEAPFNNLPWQVPADGRYLLALVATDQSGNTNPVPQDRSAAQFSILVDTERPVISLANPNGVVLAGSDDGATGRRIYKPGDQVEVRFSVADANAAPRGVAVFLQPAANARWEELGVEQPHDQAFTFAIPDIATTSARIKVQAVDVAGNLGEIVAGETFSIDNAVERGAVDIDL